MADFYAARSRIIPPLPWTSFAPPFSHGWEWAKIFGLGGRLGATADYIVPSPTLAGCARQENPLDIYSREGVRMSNTESASSVVCGMNSLDEPLDGVEHTFALEDAVWERAMSAINNGGKSPVKFVAGVRVN